MIQRLNDPKSDPAYHRPDDAIASPVGTLASDDEFSATPMTATSSLRTKRRVFTMACTAFTAGLLLIMLTTPFKNEFIVPGGLSSQHAQVLSGEGEDRCSHCHAEGNKSLLGWVSTAFFGPSPDAPTQSELCMKCHNKSLNEQQAMHPHNVSPTSLVKKTGSHQQVSFDAKMGFLPPIKDSKIACNACHREHHGADHQLATMTDAQCQSCHQKSFHSFATDHPEFVSYPLKQRSAIAFDHVSHFGKHFPARKTRFECQLCHIDDDFQNVKKLASFQQACSSCHEPQIIDSAAQGFALLSLPVIDTTALEKNAVDIGSWPMGATGEFDGQLPPAMHAMLMADTRVADILRTNGDSFDFSDIDPDNPDQVKLAGELIWAIKRLLHGLAIGGVAEMKTRLQSGLQVDINDQQIALMADGLNKIVFQNAVRRWMPNLPLEMSMQTAEERPTQTDVLQQVSTRPGSFWPTDERLYRLKPTSVPGRLDEDILAENPLHKLMGKSTESAEVSNAKTKPEKLIANDEKSESIQQTIQDPPQMEPVIASQQLVEKPVKVEKQAPTNDAVLDSSQVVAAPKTQVRPEKPKVSNSNLNDDPDLLADNPLRNFGIGQIDPQAFEEIDVPPPSETAAEAVLAKEFQYVFNPERMSWDSAPKGGWFRNDDVFALIYRPGGHSDDCLENWIELAVQSAGSGQPIQNSGLFQSLLSQTSVGLCRTCHTVDEVDGSTLTVNWKTKYRDPSVREFTKFSHGPHMIQPQLWDCSHCHNLDMERSNKESFISMNRTEITSNFLPIQKSNCISCHNDSTKAGGCTNCHSYHVGSRISGLSK